VKSRRSVQVRVSPSGEVAVEALGFSGRGCEAATAAIEAALGETISRTRKPEFWRQKSAAGNIQRLGNGEGAAP
jgi:hypothetical protein